MKKTIFRILSKIFLQVFFPVQIRGRENYRLASDRKYILISNYQSLLDLMILADSFGKDFCFVVEHSFTQKAIYKWCSQYIDLLVIDGFSSHSVKVLIKELNRGKNLMIFAEGKATTTGNIMKLQDGLSLIAEKTGAWFLPVYIKNSYLTPFSSLKHLYQPRWFQKIELLVEQSFQISWNQSLSPKQKRHSTNLSLFDKLQGMAFRSQNSDKTLWIALLDALKENSPRKIVIEDADFLPISYKRLVLGSMILGKKLSSLLKGQAQIGVLLPNSVGAVVTFFALQFHYFVPAILNFSSGSTKIILACRLANIKTILTSRRFIQKGGFESLIAAIPQEIRIVYLEDIRKQVTLSDKLLGLMRWRKARSIYYALGSAKPQDPAVILFTSGSSGIPKGVALSHRNIIANCHQFKSIIDINPKDTLFNALPIFHSFGLTVGTIAPLLFGLKVFLYPSPLHYRLIPALIYRVDATILLGTNVFFYGYAQKAHPMDFYKIRYTFAGAEKLQEITVKTWATRFGIRVLEGYGLTETSPVLSANTNHHNLLGTVGRFLPGIEFKLENVAGIKQGQKLYVKGDNLMLGYLKKDHSGEIDKQKDWFDTQDIVEVDYQGYVRIISRQKRFSKIAGEMVSLNAVEEIFTQVYPDSLSVAVAITSPTKGEEIILFSQTTEAKLSSIQKYLKEHNISLLHLPKKIYYLEEIPLLGSGKPDYPSVEEIARTRENQKKD